MVAIEQDIKPAVRNQIPSDGGIEVIATLDDRIHDCLSKADRWMAAAFKSQQYYRSEQLTTKMTKRERNRIRMVANFIRRDVDLIVGEVLDGKPVVNPVGRHPQHAELGKKLMQLLEWTRDEEGNWHQDLEEVITNCVHVGEGILFEGWDQRRRSGTGLPVAISLDPRYVFWDDGAHELQRDDAQYIIWISHDRIGTIEARWPKLFGQVQPESDDYFLVPRRDRSAQRGSVSAAAMGGYRREDERAWVKQQWEKKVITETTYVYRDNQQEATVVDPSTGEEMPITTELYDMLDPEQQTQIERRQARRVQLWESVVVNDTVVEHHLSPFDTSNGGHGMYPFAFFQYEVLADECRAHGEIEFLVSVQDIMNETVTQMLEQLFLNNVGYFHVYKGALDPEQRARLARIFYEPYGIVETAMGMPAPQPVGVNPTGLQAASNMLPVITGIADKISGISEVDRGGVPGRVESAKAISALQEKSSRLMTKAKRHIESGLQRATQLRLHNIMQFMRGPAVFDVTANSESSLLYLGWDEREVAEHYGLQQQPGPDGQPVWMNKRGEPAEIVVLNNKVASEMVFERVRLSLDTDYKYEQARRQDVVQMVLQLVGVAALPWAAKEQDWPNADQLIEDIAKRDAAMQMMQFAEDFEKKTGTNAMEALKVVMQARQAPTGAGGPGPRESTAGGPPPPPGPGAGPPPAATQGATR